MIVPLGACPGSVRRSAGAGAPAGGLVALAALVALAVLVAVGTLADATDVTASVGCGAFGAFVGFGVEAAGSGVLVVVDPVAERGAAGIVARLLRGTNEHTFCR
jgi:hypothetical protein